MPTSCEFIVGNVSPDLLHVPTTNGDHCTGDASEMVGPGARHRRGEARRPRCQNQAHRVLLSIDKVIDTLSGCRGSSLSSRRSRRR